LTFLKTCHPFDFALRQAQDALRTGLRSVGSEAAGATKNLLGVFDNKDFKEILRSLGSLRMT
jgi:hypothetical protein